MAERTSAGRSGCAPAFAVPRHVRRMLIRAFVDVRDGRDQNQSENNDAGGESPSAVRFGGYVSIDVVGHDENIVGPSWFLITRDEAASGIGKNVPKLTTFPRNSAVSSGERDLTWYTPPLDSV
jgi:hypothetical protein